MTPAPDWIPTPLLAEGPAGLPWWQWIGVIALAMGAIVVGRIVAGVLRWLLSRIVHRTSVTWDDQLLHRLDRPLRLWCSIALARVGLPFLLLDADAEATGHNILYVGVGLGLVLSALGVIDIVVSHSAQADWARARPASRQLLTLGGRIVKALVFAIAFIGFLAALGLPVASLLTGLGIGGIALAFGAQKTVENLFGAFSLGVDQPLREGDLVQIEDQAFGHVENVGLRSTRIRTYDRTLVTLPNGRLADMRIESFAMRDRCRLVTTIGLVYSTTSAQLVAVRDGFEAVLRAHPGIWPDDVQVRFAAFGASSLDINIQAWLQTTDNPTFFRWREEILIGFMRVVEQAGTAFAFPTQTVHVASLPSDEPSARRR